MVPVFSWVALAGRCRYCRAHVSVQYPLVEAATAILFAFIGVWAFSTSSFHPSELPIVLDYLIVVALLVAIFVYDLYHTIIPDPWVYVFVILAFVSQFLVPFSEEFNPWWFLFAGPLAALPLFCLWFFSRGEWMGFGDVKLALGIGWLLGPALGVFSIVLAFIIGGIVSAPLLLMSSAWGRRVIQRFTPTPTSQKLVWGFTMKSEIPFGPFLICSCIFLWFSILYGVPLAVFLVPSP